MPMDATKIFPTLDIRRKRADAFASEILRTISPILSNPDDFRIIARAVSDLCRTAGIEIITDKVRDELGLPHRSPEGWTGTELAAMELARVEAMIAPSRHFLPLATSDDNDQSHRLR